jgi:hypothetical protein
MTFDHELNGFVQYQSQIFGEINTSIQISFVSNKIENYTFQIEI